MDGHSYTAPPKANEKPENTENSPVKGGYPSQSKKLSNLSSNIGIGGTDPN
jgi:hypothetical protein